MGALRLLPKVPTTYQATPVSDRRAPPEFWRPFHSPNTLAVSRLLGRTCQQFNLLALERTGFAARRQHQGSQRSLAGVELIAEAEELMAEKGEIACCQDWFRSMVPGLLPGEQELLRVPGSSERVPMAFPRRLWSWIRVDCVSHLYKLRNRGVIQVGKTRKIPGTSCGAGRTLGGQSTALEGGACRARAACPLHSASR